MIRVLVTDDSAFMRKILSDIINSDPYLEVIGTARDGQELLEKIPELKPDVITLDISMPRMDGITALKKIMKTRPLPIVMISALSDEENTFNSLQLGAVDFIAKTSGIISIDMGKKKDIIIEKIKAASQAKIKAITGKEQETPPQEEVNKDKIVVIGASTGGPQTIESVIENLPEDFAIPIIIIQHMPIEFTSVFAKRLDNNSKLMVKQAEEANIIRPGVAYVVPGDSNLALEKKGSECRIRLVKAKPGQTINIDYTMESVAKIYKQRTIGIILTGMGRDGTKGLEAIKKNKGKTIVQQPDTATIPSMPKSAINAGVADHVVPLKTMAKDIIKIIQED